MLRFLFQLRPADNGDIHQIFQPGLVKAVQKSVTQDPRRFVAFDIQMVFQHYLVLGQRTCFIGAEDIDRA